MYIADLLRGLNQNGSLAVIPALQKEKEIKQDALGAYTCASSWIKCESF